MSQNSLGQLLTNSQENSLMFQLGDLLDPNECINGFEEFEIVEQKYNTQEALGFELPVQQPLQLFNQDQPLPTEEYAGEYNFQMLPDHRHENKSWTYSPKLKKVFTEMGSTLPICVKWAPPRSKLWVKAVMAFSSPNHRSEPVTRCPNHLAGSNQESLHLHHILSCKQNNAVYSMMNGHYIVRVPLETPHPGTDYVQMDFVFHCKNSCSAGMNRRATEVVFHLETESGEILGRRIVPVKICSCPKRDRKKDEEADKGEYPLSKKRKISLGKKFKPVYREHPQLPVEQEPEIFKFNIRIVGKSNYETLKEVAYGLMAARLARGDQSPVTASIMEEIQNMP